MAARRGEGSVFRWRNGWAADLVVGHRPDGKPVRKRITGKLQRDVLRDARKARSGIIAGRTIDKATTVERYCTQWLTKNAETLRATTWKRYEGVLRAHVFPRIGGKALAGLTASDMRALDERARREDVSPATRKHMHAIMRKLLNDAVRDELLPTNPMASVQSPTVDREKMHPLTIDEARRFEALAHEERLGALFVVALRTGMRLGEILGLQWGDVATRKGRESLSVQRGLEELGGVFSVVPTKTKRGRRIDIDRATVQALEKHKRAMKAEGHPVGATDFVFVDEKGGHVRRSNMQRRVFKPLLRAAGIDEEVRFHDLRHTHATLALQADVPAKVVQERLGHSTIMLTLDTYSHVIPTMQRDAVGKFSALLDG